MSAAIRLRTKRVFLDMTIAERTFLRWGEVSERSYKTGKRSKYKHSFEIF